MKEFDDLQELKQPGLGEMEEMNLAGGLGRFQQIAGRAFIVFKRTFFRVEEVGKGCGEKEENKNGQGEKFLRLVNHTSQNITSENKNVKFLRGAWT